jgi:hypothetical protein
MFDVLQMRVAIWLAVKRASLNPQTVRGVPVVDVIAKRAQLTAVQGGSLALKLGERPVLIER